MDDVSTYRKLHLIRPAPGKVFVIESAGSLATTQEVLDRIKRDLEAGEAHESWRRSTISSRRPCTWGA